jgi:hypothetical protein
MSDEWKGEERRARLPLSAVLSDTRELKTSVLALAEAVGARMTRDEVESSIRRTRVQIAISLGLTLFTIISLGTLIYRDQGSIKDLAESNKASIDFLEACLVPGNPCAESLQQQFDVNRNQIQYGVGCVLLIRPETRTRASVDACFAEAQARYPKPIPPAVKVP